MKVVFCINYFLPYQVAGTEVYTFQLAKYLQSKGYEAAVVFPKRGNDELPFYYEVEGLPVYTYEENDVNDKLLMRGERPPSGLMNFSKLMVKLNPDIVHFQELEAGTSIGLYHVKEVTRLGYKSVFTFHLSHYSCFTGTLMQSLQKACSGVIDASACTYCSFRTRGLSPFSAGLLNTGASVLKFTGLNTGLYKGSIATALGMHFLIEQKKKNLMELTHLVSKLVVITDWYRNILALNHIPADKIRVIKQGLPHSAITSSSPVIPVSPLRLIFIGRISQFKGVHLLLKALEGIEPSKVELDIYGPANEDDYAADCMQQTALMKNIKWKGTIKKDVVLSVMQQYHALCLPSTFSEMSPLVIQEAFAAGIPVIASNVYGNAEQIKDGVNGLLFRFNDALSLRAQILRCITDPQLVAQLQGAVLSPRSFHEVGEDYHQLYQEVLYSS
jgi:glycosyltransferase involved in cell wall biosynthesis